MKRIDRSWYSEKFFPSFISADLYCGSVRHGLLILNYQSSSYLFKFYYEDKHIKYLYFNIKNKNYQGIVIRKLKLKLNLYKKFINIFK